MALAELYSNVQRDMATFKNLYDQMRAMYQESIQREDKLSELIMELRAEISRLSEREE